MKCVYNRKASSRWPPVQSKLGFITSEFWPFLEGIMSWTPDTMENKYSAQGEPSASAFIPSFLAQTKSTQTCVCG